MPLIQSPYHPILCYSPNRKPSPKPLAHSFQSPPLFLQFQTADRQNLHYLKNLGIITSTTTTSPSSETLCWIVSVVEFLKSKGFSDSDFPRLSSRAPSIFSSTDIHRTLSPVFSFFYNDLSASPQQARGLILRCPDLLTSNATYRLKPTLDFLRELGIENLTSPTNLNAHLLNTPTEKLASKIEFLESWGLKKGEAGEICHRCPAVFGYSVENNLRPKVEYLVYEMKRSMQEVREFPQYFAFSLEKKIVARHLHLKQRDVRIPLKRMLLWSDARFYAKWK